MRFDHVGVATDDATELADIYCSLFGCEVVHDEYYQDLYIVFLDLGNGYFELLEPTEEGTIATYLESDGPGLHHFALETPDIEAAIATAKEFGVELIDETPRPGAWGHDVAFLHPKDTGGVLIEFVQH